MAAASKAETREREAVARADARAAWSETEGGLAGRVECGGHHVREGS